ncbi:MAG TPA: histidine kinase dimerization/phospho-acceptor domain-containing protein, partial [Acidimicrobiales bacterium]|nr:histidine kinase dimerization/phospho-acceptor domain-containing protein [Acidimicrobiales bacterium]
MRRSDQRRLEAALARLAAQGRPVTVPARDLVDGAALGGSTSAEDVVREIEAMAGDVLGRADHLAGVNARLEAALDILGIGVVVCDEHGRHVYRNAAAASYGRARLGDLLAERAVEDLLAEALRGVSAERPLQLFSPIRRDLNVRASPISSAQGLIGAVAVIEDTSERHRIDAIRRDFVANVSHELKTPVGALCLLAETLDGEADPKVVATLVSRVAMEADRLSRIIEDLLDLSRIEAGGPPRAERLRVAALINEAVRPLRPPAASREIRLDVADVAADVVVAGDRRDLVSAVRNLV